MAEKIDGLHAAQARVAGEHAEGDPKVATATAKGAMRRAPSRTRVVPFDSLVRSFDMTNDLMPVVAANLRRLRGDQGRTLSELARASGIAKATLSALEAGSNRRSKRFVARHGPRGAVRRPARRASPRPSHVVHASEGTSVAGTADTLRLIVRLLVALPTELDEARSPALQVHGRRARAGTREHVPRRRRLRTGSIDRRR